MNDVNRYSFGQTLRITGFKSFKRVERYLWDKKQDEWKQKTRHSLDRYELTREMIEKTQQVIWALWTSIILLKHYRKKISHGVRQGGKMCKEKSGDAAQEKQSELCGCFMEKLKKRLILKRGFERTENAGGTFYLIHLCHQKPSIKQNFQFFSGFYW